MPSKLATDSNLRQFPAFEQLFAFAYAYLSASQLLCEREVSSEEKGDWTAGSVVLMNAAHAVELFLKATILRRDESVDVWSFGHNIAALADEYERVHPEPEMTWDIPFRQPQPEARSSEQRRVFRDGFAPPSIEYRYPMTKQGEPWLRLHGFEPHSFARSLIRIKADFDRIYHYGI